MSNLTKLEQFESKLARSVSDVVSALVDEIGAQITSKEYFRNVHLPAIIGARQQYETVAPEVSSPTMEDIATTVHIISLLHSRMMYLNHRAESGIYDTDFSMRVKLLHAMQNERAIIEVQISCIKAERQQLEAPRPQTRAAITNRATE